MSKAEDTAYWQQRATIARARGDAPAERIALDELALLERLPDDYDEAPGCTDDCPEDCMADHRGET